MSVSRSVIFPSEAVNTSGTTDATDPDGFTVSVFVNPPHVIVSSCAVVKELAVLFRLTTAPVIDKYPVDATVHCGRTAFDGTGCTVTDVTGSPTTKELALRDTPVSVTAPVDAGTILIVFDTVPHVTVAGVATRK